MFTRKHTHYVPNSIYHSRTDYTLNRIALEHDGSTPVEFQDYDEEEQHVEIVMKNIVNYTDSSYSTKKLCIRIV